MDTGWTLGVRRSPSLGTGRTPNGPRAAAGGELGRSVIMIGAEYDEARLAGHYLAAGLVVFPSAVGLSFNHTLA